MYCTNHPTTLAIGVCTSCGKAVCRNCGALVDGKLLCKACDQNRFAVLTGQGNKTAPVAGGPAQNKKQDNSALVLLLILGAVVFGVISAIAVTVILAGVIAAFVFSMAGSVPDVSSPTFMVHKNVDDSTYTITLVSLGGASSVQGLHIESPYLARPDLVAPDTDLYVGQSETFSIPGQTGTVRVIAISTVDGDEQVVLDTYV